MAVLKLLNCEKAIGNIGYHFKQIREKLGYSVEFVAYHSQLESSEELLAFESNTKPLDMSRICAISNILEVPPSQVLDWIDESIEN